MNGYVAGLSVVGLEVLHFLQLGEIEGNTDKSLRYIGSHLESTFLGCGIPYLDIDPRCFLISYRFMPVTT